MRRQRFAIGSIEAKMNVSEGEIKEIKLFGDFFGLGEISDVEKVLTGVKYDKESIKAAVEEIDVKNISVISKRRFSRIVILKKRMLKKRLTSRNKKKTIKIVFNF